MELNKIYIHSDIIDHIFNNLFYEDMITFSQLNKYTYKKYKDSIKFKVYEFLNNDYKLYKECFKRYKYDEMQIKTLGLMAISEPITIWATSLSGYYDLRYIFELIMVGLDTNDIDIININKALNLKIILITLNRCKSFNRFETIENINNEPSLRSLHVLFNPTQSLHLQDRNKKNRRWIHI